MAKEPVGQIVSRKDEAPYLFDLSRLIAMSSLDTVHRSFRPLMVAIVWSLLFGFGFADSLEFFGTALGQEPASTVSASADSAEAQNESHPLRLPGR